ncbi:hypothetical protein R3P38DRAFT_2596137 [Favolaschia claudopus]|uniref:Uncharacterized protein n=1 Tax=Favolaschia claudopus TaxID=2862362 RepID=A0AAW0EBF3_9AGAR
MPRILPRLLKLPLSGNFPFNPPKPPRSTLEPVPPLHSVLPADFERSVLLSPGNIISSSHDYIHHKANAPIQRARRRRVSAITDVSKEAHRREMSPQERAWWSSPYLRMLASPLRQCFITERSIPADFLIRIAAMNVPLHLQKGRGVNKAILPDGLQHHKYKRRKAGHATYIICWRGAFDIRPVRFRRLNAAPPSRLSEYITHLLRLRILQELQLLAKQLQVLYRTRDGQPTPARQPVLRRLTRVEWERLRTTGILPYPGALAVLVVPPVNRDPVTKERPLAAGAMSDLPAAAEQPRTPPKRPVPPLSVLHSARSDWEPKAISYVEPLSDRAFWEQTRKRRAEAERPKLSSIEQLLETAKTWPDADAKEDIALPPHAEEKIPLYNGVAVFPGRVQRARLHALLTQILGVEGRWKFSAQARTLPEQKQDLIPTTNRKGDKKASHAFLVCPSDDVDVVPLAIALWRMRMWEGGGWRVDEADTEKQEHWPWVEERR